MLKEVGGGGCRGPGQIIKNSTVTEEASSMGNVFSQLTVGDEAQK